MRISLLIVLYLIAASCTRKPDIIEAKVHGNTMGTTYHITYLDDTASNFSFELDSILVVFNQVFSTYDTVSVISRFNASDTGIALIGDQLAWFRRMMLVSDTIYQNSKGAFNPAVGPLVRYWGFYDKQTSLSVQPDDATIDSLLSISKYSNIHLDQQFLLKDIPEAYLDVNAVAPGFACDLLGEFLEGKGINRYMIEIGGEIRARGKNAKGGNWTIGIMRPEELSEEMISSIGLENKSLATSGNYNKYVLVDGRKMGHTINPITGRPAINELLSSTLISECGVNADAYATACMVLGLEGAMNLISLTEGLEGYLMYTGPDGNMLTWHSKGLSQYLTE